MCSVLRFDYGCVFAIAIVIDLRCVCFDLVGLVVCDCVGGDFVVVLIGLLCGGLFVLGFGVLV